MNKGLGIAALMLLTLTSMQAQALGGDFNLTADDGSQYALRDSRGRVVVMSFGYTSCPDVCPTGLATISMALKKIGDAAERVDALFVSLDPDRDTPDLLRDYTRFFHPRLRGLTGDPERLKEIAERYRVRYAFVGKDTGDRYTLDHSASLYVIDGNGKLFRILPHGLPPSALANSLRAALTTTGHPRHPAARPGQPHD